MAMRAESPVYDDEDKRLYPSLSADALKAYKEAAKTIAEELCQRIAESPECDDEELYSLLSPDTVKAYKEAAKAIVGEEQCRRMAESPVFDDEGEGKYSLPSPDVLKAYTEAAEKAIAEEEQCRQMDVLQIRATYPDVACYKSSFVMSQIHENYMDYYTAVDEALSSAPVSTSPQHGPWNAGMSNCKEIYEKYINYVDPMEYRKFKLDLQFSGSEDESYDGDESYWSPDEDDPFYTGPYCTDSDNPLGAVGEPIPDHDDHQEDHPPVVRCYCYRCRDYTGRAS